MEDISLPSSYPQGPVQVKRPHVLNLLAPLLWSIMMLLPPLLISVTIQNLFGENNSLAITGWWLFGGVYLVFVISYFMMHIVFWYLDAWLIMPTGLVDIQLISLFNRRIAELNWGQVQDVRVAINGVLANIFNFGNITVQSASRQGLFELRSIPRAREVAQLITELSNASRRAAAQPNQAASPTHRLGEILVQQGTITPNELTLALQEQRQTGKRIGQVLIDKGFIASQDLGQALAYQYHIPYLDLSRYDIDPNVIKLMPYETAVKYHAVPVDRSPDNVISVAVAQPSNEILTDLMNQFELPLTFLVADEHYIQEAIAGHYLAGVDTPPSSPPSSTPPNTTIPIPRGEDMSGE